MFAVIRAARLGLPSTKFLDKKHRVRCEVAPGIDVIPVGEVEI
jgi:hypothetical protein